MGTGDMGGSPKPKRPINRDTIEVSNTGQRPMTHEELTSAFYTLLDKTVREEKLVSGIGEAVSIIADLLGGLMKRMDALEISNRLIGPKFDEFKNAAEATNDAPTTEIREALQKLEQQDGDRDSKLRDELDAMTDLIDKPFHKLEKRVDTLAGEMLQLAARVTAAPSAAGPPPGIPGLSELISGTQELRECLGRHEQAIKETEKAVKAVEDNLVKLGIATAEARVAGEHDPAAAERHAPHRGQGRIDGEH